MDDKTDFFEVTTKIKFSSKTLLENLETFEEFVTRLDDFLIVCDNLAYRLELKPNAAPIEKRFVEKYKVLTGVE